MMASSSSALILPLKPLHTWREHLGGKVWKYSFVSCQRFFPCSSGQINTCFSFLKTPSSISFVIYVLKTTKSFQIKIPINAMTTVMALVFHQSFIFIPDQKCLSVNENDAQKCRSLTGREQNNGHYNNHYRYHALSSFTLCIDFFSHYITVASKSLFLLMFVLSKRNLFLT